MNLQAQWLFRNYRCFADSPRCSTPWGPSIQTLRFLAPKIPYPSWASWSEASNKYWAHGSLFRKSKSFPSGKPQLCFADVIVELVALDSFGAAVKECSSPQVQSLMLHLQTPAKEFVVAEGSLSFRVLLVSPTFSRLRTRGSSSRRRQFWVSQATCKRIRAALIRKTSQPCFVGSS